MPQAQRVAMSNVDKAWLGMDTPTNLMIINGVMFFDELVDFERLKQLINERMVNRFARFRQRVVELPAGSGKMFWEDDPYFDIRTHLLHIALPAPANMKTLQEFVSSTISHAFEMNHPLWRFYLIENVEGGSVVFGRLHHCIADGIALMQVLLSLTDATPDAAVKAPAPAHPAAPPVYRSNTLLSRTIRLANRARRQIEQVASLALHEGVQTISNPTRLVEIGYTGGLLSVTSAAILAKLLVAAPDGDSMFKGELGSHKRVIWSEPMNLAAIKQISKLTNATINDVLVAAVAGALRRCMLKHGAAVDMRVMVPVNLRDPQKGLELGNQFALVYLMLPITLSAPLERLAAVKRHMDLIKSSPEPLIVYEILNVIGMLPGNLADWATLWFSTKVSAVLTNVPGPRELLYLAGKPMRRIMFWVPQTGRIGLGVSIISYNGEVMVGMMVDEALVKNPEQVMEAFYAEIDEIRQSAGSPAEQKQAESVVAE